MVCVPLIPWTLEAATCHRCHACAALDIAFFACGPVSEIQGAQEAVGSLGFAVAEAVSNVTGSCFASAPLRRLLKISAGDPEPPVPC